MHPEAYRYVEDQILKIGIDAERVLEFGSRDINGSCRSLFPHADYWGIDIGDGPGVDEIADACTYVTFDLFDLVVCMEVMEHCPKWEQLCSSAYSALGPGGIFIVTAATDPRAPHSAVDGELLPPGSGEWYENIDPEDLSDALMEAGFGSVAISVDSGHGDVYATALQ